MLPQYKNQRLLSQTRYPSFVRCDTGRRTTEQLGFKTSQKTIVCQFSVVRTSVFHLLKLWNLFPAIFCGAINQCFWLWKGFRSWKIKFADQGLTRAVVACHFYKFRSYSIDLHFSRKFQLWGDSKSCRRKPHIWKCKTGKSTGAHQYPYSWS